MSPTKYPQQMISEQNAPVQHVSNKTPLTKYPHLMASNQQRYFQGLIGERVFDYWEFNGRDHFTQENYPGGRYQAYFRDFLVQGLFDREEFNECGHFTQKLSCNRNLRKHKQVLDLGACRQYPKVYFPSTFVKTKENNCTASLKYNGLIVRNKNIYYILQKE
uniref:Uncharacterized protein n=1 Tax=Romanomermis culicivorax TaxID=13658 RepID=A0A915HW66_ROMCU